MKRIKTALLKKVGNSTIDDTLAHEQEIELLNNKLKNCRKKYNDERGKRKKAEADAYSLWETLLKAEAEIRGLKEQESELVSITKKAIENYYGLFSINSKTLSLHSIHDLEYQKSQLEKMIVSRFEFSQSKQNDLLEGYSIKKFLSNQN